MKIRLLRSATRTMIALDLLYAYLLLSRGPAYPHPGARYLTGLVLPVIAATSAFVALWLTRSRVPRRGGR